MKSSTLWLIGAAAAAYFLFGQSKAQAAPMAPPSGMPPAGYVPASMAVQPGGGHGVSISDIAKEAKNIWNVFSADKPAEMKGMDGMAPPTLAGHMDSLGAYGALGGTFYGGY